MAANGQQVTLATTATLLFSVVDGPTYIANGYTAVANPNIFKAGDENAPLPILLIFPATPNIFLGGSTVANTGAAIGALIPASYTMTYNCVGGDSLYAVAASATPVVQLLVLRQ